MVAQTLVFRGRTTPCRLCGAAGATVSVAAADEAFYISFRHNARLERVDIGLAILLGRAGTPHCAESSLSLKIEVNHNLTEGRYIVP